MLIDGKRKMLAGRWNLMLWDEAKLQLGIKMRLSWDEEIISHPANGEKLFILYLEASGFEQQLEEYAGLNQPLI